MEAVIASIGGKAGELAFDLIKQEMTYIQNYKTNLENLREGVNDLKDARQRVQQSADAAKRQGRKIYNDVDKWLTMVDHKISEMAETKLKEDEEKANEKCLIGLCPNFKSRYLLSKTAEKEADAIVQLLEKGRFDSVSYRPAPTPANGSTTGASKRVMEALKNDDSTIVGVYGARRQPMAILVKEVARLAKLELFDKVVVVTISQSPKIEKIQSHLNFDKQDKVLIILDDIWVPLDLGALGIPSSGKNMGCKILLTSRNFNVLSPMGVQRPFAIKIFNQEAAWNLFKIMGGDIVEGYDLYCTTNEVAQRCAELPIAIATIAETLKYKKAVFELMNALQELKRPFLRSFKRNLGDRYSVDVAKGWVWTESGQLDFVFGSLRILIDFSLGSFQVGVMPGSNLFQFDPFQIQIISKSGLFQIWMK
ncbi:hypothetical protein Goshw_018108 [Gossypium schwendimanii]|uniref:NB-ARC domain-containing protein n=1 Tax=Gossypium schwendimanii TaxID=34291 RepID=A0A7J9MNW6_GOSSC|nr:hypothetical protein [Gossypium schwendimanii]